MYNSKVDSNGEDNAFAQAREKRIQLWDTIMVLQFLHISYISKGSRESYIPPTFTYNDNTMANYLKQIDGKNVSQDYGSMSYTLNANIRDNFMHIISLKEKKIKVRAQAIGHGRPQKGCPYEYRLMCDNKRKLVREIKSIQRDFLIAEK